ncbi:hypothetical protein IGI37_001401 [Enterococcus sp. AZ194]
MVFSQHQALKEINLTLKSGNLIGLVGSNGAGKSTLMKLLATLSKPTEGIILLDGEDIVKKPDRMRKILGYLPQNVPTYPGLSANEFLLYMAAAKGINTKEAKKQIAALLEQFHLSEVGNRKLATFSGGMRQRVGLAATLLGDPMILIIDEPTTGLDPEERITLRNLLSELSEERIVLLSTHIVSDIEAVASQILLLRDGTLTFDGTPKELITKVTNHVWEYVNSDGTMPDETTIVSNLVQTTNGLRVREVSMEVPNKDAVHVMATLEDACLALLKGGVES